MKKTKLQKTVVNILEIYSHLVGRGSTVLAANAAIAGIGIILRFAVGVTLARSLGVTEYGTYASILALVEVVRGVALLGLQVPVTRYAALYKFESNWSLIRGLVRKSTQVVLFLSLLSSGGFLAWAIFVPAIRDAHAGMMVLLLAAILIPLSNLETLRTALLAGLDRVALSRLPELTIRPIVLIAGLSLYMASIGKAPSAETGIQLQVLASALGLFAGYWWLWRVLPSEVHSAVPASATRDWARAAIPFMFLGILQPISVQVDVLSLTFLTSSAQVGVFRISSVLAGCLALPVGVVIPIMFPKFVRLAAASDHGGMQGLIRRAIQGALLFALPGALLLIVLAGPVLSVLFGRDYAIGAPVLSVLAVAQVLTIPLLFPAQLLVASGHATVIAKATPFAIVLSVCLNLLLIPPLGALGAALASLVAQVGFNGYMAFVCYKTLSVNCLSFLPQRRHTTRTAKVEI